MSVCDGQVKSEPGRGQEKDPAELHPPSAEQVSYCEVNREPIILPQREHHQDCTRALIPEEIHIPQIY